MQLRVRIIRYEVAGESMLPEYKPGDFLLVVDTKKITKGDDVVFADPRQKSRLLIKRVVRVRNGSLFLVGLNKSASTDSRSFGRVDKENVYGKVLMRYWPFFGRGKFWFW